MSEFKGIYEGIAQVIKETYWEALERETEYTEASKELAWRASSAFLQWNLYKRKAAEMTNA